MAGMQNGPVPSKLILLSQLQATEPGDKVRFLGCVTGYSPQTAVLTLEHNHPAGNKLRALIDVKLLLNTMKSNETRIGEWLNVIGYVMSSETARTNAWNGNFEAAIPVQAIVLWSSGPLRLDSYQRSLDQQVLEADACGDQS